MNVLGGDNKIKISIEVSLWWIMVFFSFLGFASFRSLRFLVHFLGQFSSCRLSLFLCQTLNKHFHQSDTHKKNAKRKTKRKECNCKQSTEVLSGFLLVFPSGFSSAASCWSALAVVLSASSSESNENPSSVPSHTKKEYLKEWFSQTDNTCTLGFQILLQNNNNETKWWHYK